VLALDLDPRKLEVLQGEAERLGVGSVRVLAHDATRRLEGEAPFERVLIDAPCTGTGVIRRRVDLKWRKRREDIARLSAMQEAMLEAASGSVARGGVIVYASCSLEPEEGEEVVGRFLGRHPEFSPEEAARVLGAMAPEAGQLYLRTYPHRLGGAMDGFFAARLKRAS
jgi:16S rRNA (cytosine967-C5)-methyltransferase